MRFVDGISGLFLFVKPPIVLSIAYVRSLLSTCFFLSLAACSAASLQTFAMSAPKTLFIHAIIEIVFIYIYIRCTKKF